MLLGLAAVGCGERFSHSGGGGAGGESSPQSSSADSSSSNASSGSGNTGGSGGSGGEGTSSSTVSSGTGGEECIPFTEICNGEDDNCNEIADEGCPDSVALTAPTFNGHTSFGDDQNGTPFSDMCPQGTALFRISGHVNNTVTPPRVEQVRGHCAEVVLESDTDVIPYDYSVTRGSTSSLPPYGMETFFEFNYICPPDTFMVGISGLATLGIDLQNLRIYCAELIVYHSGGTSYTLGTSTPPSIEGPPPPVPDNFNDPLPSPKLVGGLRGTSGMWVHSIGIGETDPFLTSSD